MSTSKIHVLPEAVASRIAAGEVLERPSSLIRELLDNAVDAGAKRIRVRLELPREEDGWSAFRLQVEDDGCGMNRVDLGKAFLKHATSKITDIEDVFTTQTLGFRGEALAAIAAVARVECRSAESAKGEGYRVSHEGGRLKSQGAVACNKGTTVSVSDIFFNAPARRKFLRSPRAERMDMRKEHLIRALAHLDVHFTFEERVGDEPWEMIQDLPANQSLVSRVASGWGDDLAAELKPISSSGVQKGHRISGLLSSHRHRGKTRALQFFFHKGRPITNATLSAALGHAYLNLMPSRSYPACFLFLKFPDADVDVNVHPQKKDVRFRDPDGAYRLVHHSVKESLREMLEGGVQVVKPLDTRPHIFGVTPHPGLLPPQKLGQGYENVEPYSRPQQLTLAQPGLPTKQHKSPEDFHILGQWKDLFIIFLKGNDLWVADQHALHERIHFDAFSKKMEQKGPSQPLLTPLVMKPGRVGAGSLLAHSKEISALGLNVTAFGNDGVQVDELPHWVPPQQAGEVIHEVLEKLLENPKAKVTELRERFLSTAACHASVRAGERLNAGVMEELIGQFYAGGHADVCPHGRPFLFRVGEGALMKHFERPHCGRGLGEQK